MIGTITCGISVTISKIFSQIVHEVDHDIYNRKILNANLPIDMSFLFGGSSKVFIFYICMTLSMPFRISRD